MQLKSDVSHDLTLTPELMCASIMYMFLFPFPATIYLRETCLLKFFNGSLLDILILTTSLSQTTPLVTNDPATVAHCAKASAPDRYCATDESGGVLNAVTGYVWWLAKTVRWWSLLSKAC